MKTALSLFFVCFAWYGQAAEPLEPQPPRERLKRGSIDQPQTAAWLIAHHPVQASKRGRALFQRAFSAAEGASAPVAARALSAERPPRLDFAPSCLQCHNSPFGQPGAGTTTIRDALTQRSTPHLYGAGQVDALAQTIAQQLTARVDTNGDGIIQRTEAQGQALIDTGDGQVISFGSYADVNGDGFPDLDPALVVWFVDAAGYRRAHGTWRDTESKGYCIALRAFGAGGPAHAATGTTLRAAIVGAFALHAGLQAHDPVLMGAPENGGWAGIGAAGIRQIHAGVLPDNGVTRDADGMSLDDPDRDGVSAELIDGDIDVVEWFLSQQPAPRERHNDPLYAAGRAQFINMGCANCHVPNWKINNVTVTGIYSDMRSHDLGVKCHEPQADGNVITHFRTTPLWGVAHSAPYGHDGASLDLDAVIKRHGGEAAESIKLYESASDNDRNVMVGFLRTLVFEYNLQQ